MKTLTRNLLVAGLLTFSWSAHASSDFFSGKDCPPWEYDCNDWPEWTPMYWMEELSDSFDDNNNDYWRYGYAPYGPPPVYGPAPYGPPPGVVAPYGRPLPPPGFAPAPYGRPVPPPGFAPAPYGRPPVPPAPYGRPVPPRPAPQQQQQRPPAPQGK